MYVSTYVYVCVYVYYVCVFSCVCDPEVGRQIKTSILYLSTCLQGSMSTTGGFYKKKTSCLDLKTLVNMSFCDLASDWLSAQLQYNQK